MFYKFFHTVFHAATKVFDYVFVELQYGKHRLCMTIQKTATILIVGSCIMWFFGAATTLVGFCQSPMHKQPFRTHQHLVQLRRAHLGGSHTLLFLKLFCKLLFFLCVRKLSWGLFLPYLAVEWHWHLHLQSTIIIE